MRELKEPEAVKTSSLGGLSWKIVRHEKYDENAFDGIASYWTWHVSTITFNAESSFECALFDQAFVHCEQFVKKFLGVPK